MKLAAMIFGLFWLWTLIASAVFCAFDFRLFTLPFLQWWQGLFYIRNMLWLPRFRDFGSWPLLYFVHGFVLASIAVAIVVRLLLGSSRNSRQPKIYGDSKFAGVKAMAEGGITTEKR
jgi:hypothetical protein